MSLALRSQVLAHWLNLFAALGHGIVASFVLWHAECGRMPMRLLLFAVVVASALYALMGNFMMLMDKLPEQQAPRHHRH